MYITNSLLTEFDQELHDRCTYEDGVAEGRASGRSAERHCECEIYAQ